MINKNIVYLGFVSFFTDLASAMINPILPIFVVVYLHAGLDKLGLIVAIATFVSYALRLLSGYISDKYGIVKPLVVSGYALSAFSKPLMGFAASYKSVAALKALERVGKALRSAPKDALIAYYGKKNQMGKTFGFHKTLDIAGELLGTVLLFLLLYFLGKSEEIIRNIFYATIIPGVIALFIVIFFVKDTPPKKVKKEFKLTDQDKLVVGNLVFYFLFIFFFFNEAFFTIQAKEVGIETTFIPLLFIVSTLTQTLTSYISGIFIDKIGVKNTLLLSYIFGITAQTLLFLENFFFTWIAYAFLGLFTVFSLNANRAYIAAFCANRASVYGVFYAGIALFGAIGAYIVGFLWEKVGIDFALNFSLFGTIFISILFFIKAKFVTP